MPTPFLASSFRTPRATSQLQIPFSFYSPHQFSSIWKLPETMPRPQNVEHKIFHFTVGQSKWDKMENEIVLNLRTYFVHSV